VVGGADQAVHSGEGDVAPVEALRQRLGDRERLQQLASADRAGANQRVADQSDHLPSPQQKFLRRFALDVCCHLSDHATKFRFAARACRPPANLGDAMSFVRRHGRQPSVKFRWADGLTKTFRLIFKT
jgi:hypothetical protein